MLTDFRLKVFKTVAEQLSYTRAATILCITQPAVSKHINELEKQLGVALFTRQGNKIQITNSGKKLLVHARKILDYYRILNDDFIDENSLNKGSINIGASTTIAQYLLPAILAKFKQNYENIKVSLLNGNSEQIERWVSNEQIDIGLIEGDICSPNLHYEKLKDDKIVLVTSANNKQFNKVSIDLLKQLPLVLREDGSGTLDVIDSTLAKCNVYRKDLNIIIQLGSTESIKRYLLNSKTYALTSIVAVKDELEKGVLREVEIIGVEINRAFRFVSVHGQHNRIVNLFKQFCFTNL